MQRRAHKPLTCEEMAEQLHLSGVQLKIFWIVLADMEKQGRVVKTCYDTYGLPERMSLIKGILSMSQKGFGFVVSEKKEEDDIFIPPGATLDAMHGDTVMARISSRKHHGRQAEGEIIKVLQRKNTSIIGTFSTRGQFGFLVPDDSKIMQDIFIPLKHFHGAKDGQKVIVEITVWPRRHRNAEGKITEILGDINDNGVDILSIIKQHELAIEFPEKVLDAADKISDFVEPQDEEKRRNLRDRIIVTIDSDDAKDLDDAVYVEQLPDEKWLLGVYIADVSHYVEENAELDMEARERGTSVYLVDRVLPMLPERLSNGICSLNAGVDRLVMSCEMKIDSAGEVFGYEIFPAVINISKRLSYPVVRQAIEEDKTPEEISPQLVKILREMGALSKILRKKRMNRGAIDFDFPEQKVIIDAAGKPVEIKQVKRTIAESIIEEFMLCANETVAKHLYELHMPSLYRVHEEPEDEKMLSLGTLLATFGLKLSRTKKVTPANLQSILGKVAGRTEEALISKVMLRSLKQAEYKAENLGHFGLAAKYYTHFTSPIRRYPDLVVHRLLKERAATRKLTAKRSEKLEKLLPEIAEHSSKKERVAEQAERETKDLKKVEYMLNYIGAEFDGNISGVTSYGLFVELDNGVEGLLHIAALSDDYYIYVEGEYSLVGEGSGKTFRLGDAITVEVLQANVTTRTVDFVLPGEKLVARQKTIERLKERHSKSTKPAKKTRTYTGKNKDKNKKSVKKKRG